MEKREWRKKTGPSISLSFTAPPAETSVLEEAAKKVGLSRAAFFYHAAMKEARRVLRTGGVSA